MTSIWNDRPSFALENLEPRLLLTTLHGGDYFIYNNSQGSAVRVQLNGETSDCIELLALNAAGQAIDVVGLLYPSTGGRTIIGWPDSNTYTYPVVERQVNGGVVTESWSEFGAWLPANNWIGQGALPANPPAGINQYKSSRTEIFAIYVSNCTATTSITISTVASNGFNGGNWNDVNTFASTNLPTILLYNNAEIKPPEGSGGAVIGSIYSPVGGNQSRYVGTDDFSPRDLLRLGVFPGGELRPGVQIGSGELRFTSGQTIATNLAGLAVDSAGTIFGVDNTAFTGSIIRTGSQYSFGTDVSAFTIRANGTRWFVNNTPSDIYRASFAGNIGSMAAANSAVFFINSDNSSLYVWNGAKDAQNVDLPPTLRGVVQNDDYQFNQVSGLAFNGNELWGVANAIVDLKADLADRPPLPTVPMLIQIDRINGRVLQALAIDATQVNLTGMTVDADTGIFYVVDASARRLLQMNPTVVDGDGKVIVAAVALTNADGGKELFGAQGIELIGDTFYVTTTASTDPDLPQIALKPSLFKVDPATGVCTLVRELSTAATSAMAYEPTLFPGYLITADANSLVLVPLGSTLHTLNNNNLPTLVGVLVDAGNPLLVYKNVVAMDFAPDGSLFVAGTQESIDSVGAPVNQSVIVGVAVGSGQASNAAAMATAAASMAFHSDGSCYVIDAANDLVTVDVTNGNVTPISAILEAGITGIDFMQINGNQVLLGVTDTSFVTIDTNPGSGSVVVLGDTGLTNLVGFAVDTNNGNYVYALTSVPPAQATAVTQHQEVRINLTSQYLQITEAGGSHFLGHLFDGVNPAWVFSNITALDAFAENTTYAVGTIYSLDPVNSPAPLNTTVLLQIINSGVVFPVVDDAPPITVSVVAVGSLDSPMSSIAFSSDDQLYGVNSDNGHLVIISPIDLSSTDLGLLSQTGLIGIDFVDGELYGNNGTELFSIDLDTLECTSVLDISDTGLPNMTSLASKLGSNIMFSTIQNQAGDGYELIQIATDAASAYMDFGRLHLAGSLVGIFHNYGNVEAFKLGFLWGSVYSDKNITAVIMEKGGGALVGPQGSLLHSPEESIISAGGSIAMVNSRGLGLYSAVESQNSEMVAAPDSAFVSLETTTSGWTAAEVDTGWREGLFVDYRNDTVPWLNADRNSQAEFFNHISGSYTISGSLVDEDGPRYVFMGNPYVVDWHGLPLMAGQTVTITCSMNPYTRVLMYNSSGHLVGSYGYETNEDEGIWSFAPGGGTAKPLVFTAPEADTYYIAVIADPVNGAGYTLSIADGSEASLGAVNVKGEYLGYNSNEDGNNIASHGGIGSVIISERLGGLVDALPMYAGIVAIGNYDLVCVQSSTMLAIAIGDSNVGRVQTTAGDMGEIGGYTNLISAGNPNVNNNAQLQNIVCAGTFWFDMYYRTSNTISSTGSIGVIKVTGNLLGVTIAANADNAGPRGCSIDLIEVGGDWGGMGGAPRLKHGPGGNVRFIQVEGDIFVVDFLGNVNLAYETIVLGGNASTAPKSSTIYDDGGSRTVITPVLTPHLDALGNAVLNAAGQPTYYMPTYSYIYIGVDDSIDNVNTDGFIGSGTGGVVARLKSNGSLIISTTTGAVDIGHFDLSGVHDVPDGQTPYARVQFAGGGTTTVYYAELDPDDAQKFENRARLIWDSSSSVTSNLVSGYLVADVTMTLTGSLGSPTGSTGARLFGVDPAPAADVTTTRDASAKLSDQEEPLYGLFARRVNGLQIIGNLYSLSVGGSLGDLRVARIPSEAAATTPTTGIISRIIVDSDGRTRLGNWDGVNGVVWAGTRIGSIEVGDGLADDGGADRARAGIFSRGSIEKVTISGPRYVRDGFVFGELNGIIAGYSNETLLIPRANARPDANGDIPTDKKNIFAVHSVIGTNGAQSTAIIGGLDLDAFMVFSHPIYLDPPPEAVGGVHTVSFSGVGAEIHGTQIRGTFIRNIIVSANGNGINNSHFQATNPPAGWYGINYISAGGSGITNSTISSIGYGIGTIEGTTSTANLTGTYVASADVIGKIKFVHILGGKITANGVIREITTSGSIVGNKARVGAMLNVNVKGNFSGNDWWIARLLSNMTVGGYFEDSDLIIDGPSEGELRRLTVGKGIIGTNQIVSAGSIGRIVTRAGGIEGTIGTIAGGWNNNIDLIQSGAGITADIICNGSINKIIANGSVGLNPATTSSFSNISATGNVKLIEIRRKAGVPSHLYANIQVGGDLGTLNIGGTMFSDVAVDGNLGKLIVRGGLGGLLDVDQDGDNDQVGSLNVVGYISSMSFPGNYDIVADLTIGGSIKAIALKGGSILGNIESRYGSITKITLNGGSIEGSITGASIGTISLTNAALNADVTATRGSIGSVSVKNGDLNGSLSAANGDIGSVIVSGGDITAGQSIVAGGDIGRVRITGGSLDASVQAGGRIGEVNVQQDINQSIDAGTGIGTVRAGGDITATTIRSGGMLDNLFAANMIGSIISAGTGMGNLRMTQNASNSFILSGLLVGEGIDGILGTADDDLDGVLHSGNINLLTIGGLLDGTIVAAGIGPDGDSDFLNGTETAAGTSKIGRIIVGGFANPAQSAVLADTSIDSAFRALATAGAPAMALSAGADADLAADGVQFGPGTATPVLLLPELRITMTGPGVAFFNADTGHLTLNRTTSATKLSITGTFATPITLDVSEDAALGSLISSSTITLSNINIDGFLGNLNVGALADASLINLPGGATTVRIDPSDTMTFVGGRIGTLTLIGNLDAGSLTMDSVRTLQTSGSLGADVTVNHGSAGTISVGESLSGDVSVNGTVNSFGVGLDMSGGLSISQGDLNRFQIGRTLSNSVSVANGRIGTAVIKTGDLDTTGWIRSQQGIGTLDIRKGSLLGLVATDGGLSTLKVAREVTGRVGAYRSIGTVTMGSLVGGTISSALDVRKVVIGGNMTDGLILAGIDLGDDGIGGVESDNLLVDALAAVVGPANSDACAGGRITSVIIAGTMIRSSIAAGIDAGADGYFGSDDDLVGGTGYITKVTVRKDIFGGAGISYGVYAASNTPKVFSYGQRFMYDGSNAYVKSMA